MFYLMDIMIMLSCAVGVEGRRQQSVCFTYFKPCATRIYVRYVFKHSVQGQL